MAGWTPGNGAHRPLQTKLMAEINVTPMVDVMLVLLVIFMLTAPLLVAGVPVELPKNSAQRISQPKKPVIVTFAADSSLFIRDERVDAASLISRLSALRTAEGDTVVYVRADKKIPYGEVMGLLGRLGASGYQRISLLSQPANQDAIETNSHDAAPLAPAQQ
jgi:biopolymer transport protein ExbD